ncbi:MAG: PAS domain-containing protein [Flavobacterium sp.]
MKNAHYCFSQNTFDSFVPFNILIGNDLKIKDTGPSLKKIFPSIKSGDDFSTSFSLNEPYAQSTDWDKLCSSTNQTVTLHNVIKPIILLKGKITKSNSDYLFIGSPVFEDLDQLLSLGLTTDDFSIYSPLIEYLKNNENQRLRNDGLNDRIIKFEMQQEVLEKEKQELNAISVVASGNNNGVVFCKSNGNIYWCNDAYVNLTGLSKNEIYGKTPIEVGRSSETDTDDLRKMVNAFQEKKSFDIELLHRTKSGSSFWARIKGQPIKGENGKTDYFAMIDDITSDKAKEEKLQILSSIAAVNINAVIISDKDGNIEWVNESFERMTGYTLDEVAGRKPGKFLQGEETNPETIAYLKDKIVKGEPFNCDILNYSKSKQKYWIRIQGQAIRDKYGKIFKFFAIEQDVSLEKIFLESIKAEKEKYSNVIANMKMGLLEVNLNDEILFANQSFCDMIGSPITDLLGTKANALFNKENYENVINFISSTSENSTSCEVEVHTKKGEVKYLIVSGAPNYTIKGELIGYIGVHLDITNQKNLENQKEQLLLRLEKQNEQLNDYAQIVAHDLKSPLRSIHALISWIKEDNFEALHKNTLDYLNKIESKVEKMDHFIQGILTYSKIDALDLSTEEVDVNDVIKNIISVIDVPETVSINIVQQLPIIMADKYRMQQLFQNLIGNAVTYIDKNPGLVNIDFKEEEQSYVFSIEDNGPGIAKENQERVFAIFQSFTKSEHSTGIGLSIVKRIIDNYKGEIWIESIVTKGTTFFVRIPKSIT